MLTTWYVIPNKGFNISLFILEFHTNYVVCNFFINYSYNIFFCFSFILTTWCVIGRELIEQYKVIDRFMLTTWYVIKCLKMLTFVPIDEIKQYEKLEGSELNKIKELLRRY